MNIFNRQKTLKPIKAHKGRRGELSEFAKATLSTLGSGSMIEAVKLPKNEDPNEWLAVNTVDFFNEISMLYGTISEYCTKGTCPVMSAGPKVQYLWADGVKVKKPIACTAPEYVDLLLTWVESQLNDEEIFPIKFDSSYPKNFKQICSVIYKRFFRVYVHIYHSHFKRIQRLGASAHLNTCFKHFIYFVKEYKLVDAKELAPLQEIIDGMMGQDKTKYMIINKIANKIINKNKRIKVPSLNLLKASPPPPKLNMHYQHFMLDSSPNLNASSSSS